MKKMRRMIPALCMLLVSAIMLSTASYAWFTMNEQVEATGMQVQAQAGGAMIIGTDLLTESDQSWTADFATTTGNKKISPMTRLDGGWKVPADPKLVDGASGHYTGTGWDAAGVTGYYIDYVVYIAVSGDVVTKNIQATLAANASDLGIKGAYAVAFYVDKTNAEIVDSLEPDLLLHVDADMRYGKWNGAGEVDAPVSINTGKLFKEAKAIPSTVGVADTDPGVGIRVVMRVFVDGTLRTGGTTYAQAPVYTLASGKYDADETYYVLVEGETDKYELAPDFNMNEEDDIPDGWYTYEGMAATEEIIPVYYVRNKTAPDTPTGLNVTFELVDDVAAQG